MKTMTPLSFTKPLLSLALHATLRGHDPVLATEGFHFISPAENKTLENVLPAFVPTLFCHGDLPKFSKPKEKEPVVELAAMTWQNGLFCFVSGVLPWLLCLGAGLSIYRQKRANEKLEAPSAPKRDDFTIDVGEEPLKRGLVLPFKPRAKPENGSDPKSRP
jgi:hypothetical protein